MAILFLRTCNNALDTYKTPDKSYSEEEEFISKGYDYPYHYLLWLMGIHLCNYFEDRAEISDLVL